MSSMNSDLERIQHELLDEYEREGDLDIAEWVRSHPKHRDELISYWIWLRGTTRPDEAGDALPPPRDDVAEQALRRAIQAIALGPSWLADAVGEQEDQVRTLGKSLQALRQEPYEFRGKAGKPFRQAAVYAWIALSLGQHRSSVSRLATQKVAYFIEGGLKLGLFSDHKQMPLGPYDSLSKYKTAEPIAVKQSFLRVRGAEIEPGTKSQKALGYASRYLRSPDLAGKLVDFLARLSDGELETLATVDWVARSLSSKGQDVSVEGILDALEASSKWRQKLGKPNFSSVRIGEALTQLARLRLVDLGDSREE